MSTEGNNGLMYEGCVGTWGSVKQLLLRPWRYSEVWTYCYIARVKVDDSGNLAEALY